MVVHDDPEKSVGLNAVRPCSPAVHARHATVLNALAPRRVRSVGETWVRVGLWARAGGYGLARALGW